MDPEKVTLRHFLDVAFGIFVDEYRKMGMGLMEALDAMSQWARGGGDLAPETRSNDNAAALAQLNAMMKDMR